MSFLLDIDAKNKFKASKKFFEGMIESQNSIQN